VFEVFLIVSKLSKVCVMMPIVYRY